MQIVRFKKSECEREGEIEGQSERERKKGRKIDRYIQKVSERERQIYRWRDIEGESETVMGKDRQHYLLREDME